MPESRSAIWSGHNSAMQFESGKWMEKQFSCECGKSVVSVSGQPLARFICHCQTCRRFTGNEANDECAFLAKNLRVADFSGLVWSKEQPGLALERGRCQHCKSPVISFFRHGAVGLAFAPTRLLSKSMSPPDLDLHVFYHRRTYQVNDAVPKISGYWASQARILLLLGQRLLKGPPRA